MHNLHAEHAAIIPFCSLLYNKSGLDKNSGSISLVFFFELRRQSSLTYGGVWKQLDVKKNTLKGYNYFYYSMSSGSYCSLQNSLTKIQYISLSSHFFCVLFLLLFSVPIFGFFPHFLVFMAPEGLKCLEAQKFWGSPSFVFCNNWNSYRLLLSLHSQAGEGEWKLVWAAVAVPILRCRRSAGLLASHRSSFGDHVASLLSI